MSMPFFSVIIPLYNKAHFIENTLKSVLAQTFDDFEIIIVNDGSTDGSEEKVQSFDDSRIHYYFQENQGVSAARNFGIEKAAADYITFLDADDYWYPQFLETMKSNTGKFPEQKVFSAAVEIETSRSVIPAQYSISKTSDCELVNYFSASNIVTAICTSAAVFDKSVFEKCGVFDVNLKNSEDIDLWMRIGLEYPVVFCWKILARYVYDTSSLSKNNNLNIDFEKFLSLEKTNSDLKKFLDLNRFSLAIKSKINNDTESFNAFYTAIDLKNLSFKKRFLLSQPAFILKKLIALKEIMADAGLGSTVFK